MATYNSFSDLQTAVFRWLNREDDADAMDRAAEFIGLAEASIRREQEWFTQIYSLENDGNAFPVGANPTELPVNVYAIKNMWCATGVSKDTIEIIPISGWRDLVSSNNDASGIPQKAVIAPQMDKWMKDDGTRQGPKLYLWPQPAADSNGDPFLIDFQYIRDVAPLSEDVLNNGLFLRHPDLYLYGALIESAPYYQHDERLQIWQARFDKAVREINIERERVEFGASAKRVRLPRTF